MYSIYMDLASFLSHKEKIIALLDSLVALGFLFGMFAEDNPNCDYYKYVLRPFWNEEKHSPLTARILKQPVTIEINSASAEVEIQHEEKVNLLKKFWPKVFAHYWVSSRHVADFSSASPLGQNTLAESRLRNSKKLSDILAPEGYNAKRQHDRAQALQAAQHQQKRESLEQTLQVLLTTYRDEYVDFRLIRQHMTRQLAHEILELIVVSLDGMSINDLTNDKMLELSQSLNRIVEKNNAGFRSACLPQNFSTLAPIEQIALLAFSSFVHNGDATIGRNNRIVSILDAVIIPLLNQHHPAPSTPIEFIPPNEKLERDDIASILEAAKAKLKSMDLKNDGLASIDHPIITEFLGVVEATFMSSVINRSASNHFPTKEIFKRAALELLLFTMPVIGVVFLYSSAYALSEFVHFDNLDQFPRFLLYQTLVLISLSFFTFHLESLDVAIKTYRTVNPLTEQMGEIIDQARLAQPLLFKNKPTLERAGQMALIMTTVWIIAFFTLSKMKQDTDQANGPQFAGVGSAYQIDNDSVGNSVEQGELKNEVLPPTFITYGNETNNLFWVNETCQPSADFFHCDNISYTNYEQLPHHFVQSNNLASFTKNAVDQGGVVRFNINRAVNYFEVPIGYKPLYYFSNEPESDTSASWHPQDGVRVLTTKSNTIVGVVYVPISKISQVASSSFDPPYLSDGPLDTANLQESLHSEDQALLNRISNEVARGTHPLIILQSIEQHLTDIGIEFGYSDFYSDYKGPDEILFDLLQRNPDGTMLNKKMICNQMAFVVYSFAKEAGLEVKLVSGFAQEKGTEYAGFEDNAHTIVLYRVNGNWEAFDATLPSYDFTPNRSLQFEKEERWIEAINKKELLMSLATKGILTGYGLVLTEMLWQSLKNKYTQKKTVRRRKVREKILTLQDSLEDGPRLAVSHVLLALVGAKDIVPDSEQQLSFTNEWYSFAAGELEPTRANAGHIAMVCIQIAISEAKVGTSSSDTRGKMNEFLEQLAKTEKKLRDKKNDALRAARYEKLLKPAAESHSSLIAHLSWVLMEIPDQMKLLEKKRQREFTAAEIGRIQQVTVFFNEFLLSIDAELQLSNVGAEGFEPPTSSM